MTAKQKKEKVKFGGGLLSQVKMFQQFSPEPLKPMQDLTHKSDEELQAMEAQYRREGFPKMANALSQLLATVSVRWLGPPISDGFCRVLSR
jgi:hypothetical protein